ncbi:cytochrome P450 [Streptomyces sp. NPDC048710]|uniref:cytochrome P450 n=1 Tax=Streptomyces sp. NPDC048710 TaxID=3365586 RepID=UPI0037245C81
MTTWKGETAWLVTRHADQLALLRDGRVGADSTRPGYPSINAVNEAFIAHNRTFITMDGAEHRDQRRRFAGYFTVRRVQAMRPRIQSLIDDLLDTMESAGPPADLVTAFALPLPSLVICDLLGIPYEDHAFFQRTSATMLNVRSTAEESLGASREILGYLGDLLRAKRENPADDLLGHLATHYLATGLSTADECAKQARLLLVAGHETTAGMIALGVCALLRHPEQLAAVRAADAAQTANAVEELLRYLSTAHTGRRRVALADIEIGGRLIRAGEGIICAGELANRDPDAFPAPERLDIARQAPHRHLAFGSGPHQCLGQNLARLELRLAYRALLDRFPHLRLAQPPDTIPYRAEMAFYGVDELAVTW